MEEEKKYYFLHCEDSDWDEDIPLKLSKKEKDLIEWFLDIANVDYLYLRAFIPENCREFEG